MDSSALAVIFSLLSKMNRLDMMNTAATKMTPPQATAIPLMCSLMKAMATLSASTALLRAAIRNQTSWRQSIASPSAA